MTPGADAEREVRELHEFFESWLGGQSAPTDEAFGRVEAAIPDDFEMVAPSGERRPGPSVRADLRAGHGAFADSEPAFEIRIADVGVRVEREAGCLLTYEEWQRTDGDWSGRLSSALFRRADPAPNGVEWVHLHETWLPADAEPPA